MDVLPLRVDADFSNTLLAPIRMVPSGWSGDILGQRRFLTVIVWLWSLLTILSAYVSYP